MWTWIARAPAVEVMPSICTDETSDRPLQDSCYDAKQAISTDPHYANTLEWILKDSDIDPELVSIGSLQRLIVMRASGNQEFEFALCELENNQTIRNCLIRKATAQSNKRLLADGQFLVLNGPEIHAQTFQLIDMRALRILQVTPPPMERLADVAVSANGRWMAAMTAAGEVWLYDINRESSTAKIVTRFDFRGMIGNSRSANLTEDEPGRRDEADELFNRVVFVSDERLALAGRRGGVVLAAIPTGAVVWTRPPVTLSGEAWQTIAASSNTLIIHDHKLMQLISLTSGALLSGVVDLGALPVDAVGTEKSTEGDRLTLETGPDGEIRIVYRGDVYASVGLWGGSVPDLTSIEQRTGFSRVGTAQPLTYFLGDRPGTFAK